jgi:uncharacterized protein YutE (UPF0331/DUF86 family)
MEVFKEIINLVGLISWPLTVIILGFAFRKTINGLMDRINSAKYKELEIDFKQIMAESEEIIIKSNIEKSNGKLRSYSMTTEFLNKIKQISDVSPRSLIIESWIQLETALNDIAKNNLSGSVRPALNVHELVNKNLIEKTDMEVYNNVRKIRNNIMHNYNYKVTQDESIEYALLIYRLMENINNKVKKDA